MTSALCSTPHRVATLRRDSPSSDDAQGRAILPGAALFEMAVAAGRLLWTSERDGDPCGLQDASILAPVLLPIPETPSPQMVSSAAHSAVLTCAMDGRNGAVLLEAPGAGEGSRQARHMAASLYRHPEARLTAAESSNSSGNSPAPPAVQQPKLWLPAPDTLFARQTGVTADLCGDCQHDSGYRVHPALTDAAIHAGAAARSADDKSFLVSVSAACYATPATLPAESLHVGVQLSALGADGAVLSSHRLGAADANALGSILGVQAKPPSRPPVARPLAVQPGVASSARSMALHAAQHAAWVPAVDASYIAPALVPRTLPNTMPSVGPGFSNRIRHAPLRDDLPPGFDDGVDAFERWCTRLLLGGFQRLGFFTAAGDTETKQSIMRKVLPCSVCWLIGVHFASS